LLPLPLPRYDFLLLWCLLVQAAMLATRLETRDELKVICLFHLIGLGLELFKTATGSWSYPEPGYTKVLGRVPLYSGFMYASVASYICQAWRRLALELTDPPRGRFSVPLALAIYANFFLHQLGWPDLRWGLMLAVPLVFRHSVVHFTVERRCFKMPLALSFVLIGFFLYLAENVATFFGAWQYPNQRDGWALVHASKFSSWFLLVIVSFILVAFLKQVKGRQEFKDDLPKIEV
jgi:uncharacterized membrane protein YoaT (DUF817 family)